MHRKADNASTFVEIFVNFFHLIYGLQCSEAINEWLLVFNSIFCLKVEKEVNMGGTFGYKFLFSLPECFEFGCYGFVASFSSIINLSLRIIYPFSTRYESVSMVFYNNNTDMTRWLL